MQRGTAAAQAAQQTEIGRSERVVPAPAGAASGLEYARVFSREGVDPFDEIEWDLRSAVIGNEKGEVVFEQRDVEMPQVLVAAGDQHRRLEVFPRHASARPSASAASSSSSAAWSTRSRAGRASRSTSRARTTCRRSATSSSTCSSTRRRRSTARSGSTSASSRSRSARPASSTRCRTRWTRSWRWPRPRACSSSTARAPARTSRPIRSSRELLAGGGTASGPVSFMKGFDAFAGVIKSGGKTRRAAKMVILNADHPDIVEFINCKVEEEKKAWALIDAGYDGSFTGPAYASVFFQNSNNSVRVTDEFMRAVLDDREWQTRAVTTGERDGHLQGARPDAADRRGDVGLRRPGHAVRHHGQRLAHLPEHGAHQRQQPVLGVHVPRRLGVQPGVDQPDEVRRRPRRVRRRRASAPRAGRSSRRRRSWSTTRATRPGRSSATATPTGRSASATPTSARC